MVRDANGQKQAIVGDIPGLLRVKSVGHCFSGSHLELQFLNRQKTAWFVAQILCTTAYEDVSSGGVLCLQFSVVRYFQSRASDFTSWRTNVQRRNIFLFFWCRAADFHHNFIFIQFFPFQIPTCSLYFTRSNNASVRFPVLYGGYYCCSSIFPSTCFSSFQNVFHEWFSFSRHCQKVKQAYVWRIIVACIHRGHAKPFLL